MTPWSTRVEIVDDGFDGIADVVEVVRVTAMLSLDPGPMREFSAFLAIDLDEAHATELLGELSLALQTLRERRGESL